MKIINYSDFIDRKTMIELCKKEKVIFDFQLWDIPNTMRRNIKTSAELGAYAITIADNPLNVQGIKEAYKAGEKYNIKIILGKNFL